MELQKMEEQEGLEMLNGSVPECDKARSLEDGDPTAEVTAAEQEGFLPHAAGKKLSQFTDFEGKTSFGMSVFNLSNAIMGSGILGLAYAMSNTGIVLFVVLLICIALLSAYSIHLLLKCAGVVGIRAYEELGYRAFGPGGKVVAAVVICVHNTGAMSSYLYIVKYELPLVIQTFLGLTENTENWYMNGNVLIIIVSVCVILPLALMKHLGYLGYTSGLSLTCMVFFLMSVIYKKFQISCPLNGTEPVTPLVYYNGHNASTAGTAGDECTAQTFTVNSQTAYTIPILAFAFVCHPEVLPIYTELRRASKRRMQSVANVSILAMFIMYLLTAIFGYLTFYGNVESEMLHTYSEVDPLDRLILCVRLAVLMAVTLTVPVVLFPIRRAIQQLLFHGKDFSWVRHVSIAIGLLFVVNLLVIFVPNIRDIFGVIGATSAPSLIFILPSIFYLRIVPNEKEPLRSRPKIQATCFAALGFVFMVMSLSFIVADWVTTGRSSGGGH
ncbi:sodium-coupled neutral amino acid transporter 5 [Dermochelys coriacea]|uniref:sodium-coupled neutral amino acid transporter 5 n=1 Tax=Dermochelys coriacea TaxID=27794 RepID=UPI0018E7DF58|nr:sodium-coupled neutral amino acid transporter 5 [Dermochelys coriacea]XP_038237248.1 sodium-coupled neutral amino acid transporter 5 [Dermochelys coriacea]XP_038237250.1 sodium-coupled neutral amino acid transporter 5 [Dermochelys coriacea]XP_038237251.1 sodium-coupled neutral amino acid transporter 5 [Dermochelys coriacea]XP_038237252.1 sodium-coupled neutral amino acid transporter 5 [Dermochelys coriacea]XP_043357488.1 sodium-coupled neutral amino acid transporter 5 [Dermochelys coriacea]